MELEQELQTQHFPKTPHSIVRLLYNTDPLIPHKFAVSYLRYDVPVELDDVFAKSPLGLNLGALKG